jgi:hypothetical protein
MAYSPKWKPTKGTVKNVKIITVPEEPIHGEKYGDFWPFEILVDGVQSSWAVNERLYGYAKAHLVEGAMVTVDYTKDYVEVKGMNDLSQAVEERTAPKPPPVERNVPKQTESDVFHPSRRNMLLSYWKDLVIAGKFKLSDTDWLRKMDDFVEKGVVPSVDEDAPTETSENLGTLLGCPAEPLQITNFIATLRSVAKCNSAHGDKTFDFAVNKLAQLFDEYMGRPMGMVYTLKTRDAKGLDELIGGQDKAFVEWATKELDKELDDGLKNI